MGSLQDLIDEETGEDLYEGATDIETPRVNEARHQLPNLSSDFPVYLFA